MSAVVRPPAASAAGWRAELMLGFARQGERTALVDRRVCMPLAIQRPFYPEGSRVCHVLLLHPPGGLVGGDLLDMRLDLQAQSEVLVTTPAAGKWYRGQREARQIGRVQVAADAHLEWLPQESIVFDGALADQQLRVELAPGATWLGWDITRFGRSAGGERFRSGRWRARTEVWREGEPLWIDRQQLDGGSRLLDSAYGLAGQPVIGTLAWIGKAVTPELIGKARELWTTLGETGEAGVTRLPHGLLCRYRGPSSGVAREWFVQVWDLVRRAHRGRAAQPPRIWKT
jgi:urease accessory protein